MPTRLWRFFALAGALFALAFSVLDGAYLGSFSDTHFASEAVVEGRELPQRVTKVDDDSVATGGLRIGDIITPVGPYTLRMRQGGELPGTTDTWIVRRGTQRPFKTQTHVTQLSGNDLVVSEIFNFVRVAMILIAIVVAVRRPEAPAARALVTFLITMGFTLMPGGAWLPDSLLAVWRTVRLPIQLFSLAQALHFACIFPFRSAHGFRAWIERINPYYTAVDMVANTVLSIILLNGARYPLTGGWHLLADWLSIITLPLLFPVFFIAAIEATGRDRVRVYWAAGSICLGFTGPLVQIFLLLVFHREDEFMNFLPLTLIALPLGLAYTILRHRTVDIGFVISRALVLAILSFAIVGIFGVLERTLGKLFIDASHIASRSVEIALALGLGFSLRTLHNRIEKIVDQIFFRTRRRALATLKTFAEDVYFITDPDVAIERTVRVVGSTADAENAALYLIADGVFGCAAAIEDALLPAEVDENDPILVRMRASRKNELLRHTGSVLDMEIAFPMFVRGTLIGALTLAAKRSGEAYDPEETALIADLAQRVGLALDALQTLALRRELDALQPAATSGAVSAF